MAVQGESLKSITTLTPSYKSFSQKEQYELSTENVLPEPVGDYKVKKMQDHFKLQIVDPAVESTNYVYTAKQQIPSKNIRSTLDFPSGHSKRSLIDLKPLEQRKKKAVENRSITTSAYLTESVDRHRNIEASKLREYLRAREGDENDVRIKVKHSSPPATDDLDQFASLNEQMLQRSKERQTGYQFVESKILKEAPNTNKLKDQMSDLMESRLSNDASMNSSIQQQDRSGYVTDASSATWQFSSQHSFSPRSIVSMNGSPTAIASHVNNSHTTSNGLLKVRTDLSPARSSRSNDPVQTAKRDQNWPYTSTVFGPVAGSVQSTRTREFEENYSRKIERYGSLPTFNDDALGTLITIKDNKPKGIMKRRELESKDDMIYVNQPRRTSESYDWEKLQRPKVTEQIQKLEEHTRIEEIEKRLHKKGKKTRKHKNSNERYFHGDSRHLYGYGDREHNGSHHRDTRRTETVISNLNNENSSFGNEMMKATHCGYFSDSLRRGEMRYKPNGELKVVRQTPSPRGTYNFGSNNITNDFHRSLSLDRHDSNLQNGNPVVEFPPTLPRPRTEADCDPPPPPPHRYHNPSDALYRPITKSRSYADWEEGHGYLQTQMRRERDMARLENEFRDSLLMPLRTMPQIGGNMHEYDHFQEQIPGGYETYDREMKSKSGSRLNQDGNTTHFSEQSQEYVYKQDRESERGH